MHSFNNETTSLAIDIHFDYTSLTCWCGKYSLHIIGNVLRRASIETMLDDEVPNHPGWSKASTEGLLLYYLVSAQSCMHVLGPNTAHAHA